MKDTKVKDFERLRNLANGQDPNEGMSEIDMVISYKGTGRGGKGKQKPTRFRKLNDPPKTT